MKTFLSVFSLLWLFQIVLSWNNVGISRRITLQFHLKALEDSNAENTSTKGFGKKTPNKVVLEEEKDAGTKTYEKQAKRGVIVILYSIVIQRIFAF
jgi:hypothetical protein